MCFKKWFRKKEPEKPKKMDLSMYQMKMTVKSICMFERLAKKSFFKFVDEDIPLLMYAIFYTSNSLDIKFETFVGILENPQIARWAATKFTDLLEVNRQFNGEEEKVEAKEGEENTMTMTDIATSLIIDYHMDAHYVMYEMSVWEIEPLFKACDAMVKKHYEEQRLWSYIEVMPHIDGKKVKGPESLLPFPWEKEVRKKRVEENLKNNLYAVKHTIGKNIDDILNGR